MPGFLIASPLTQKVIFIALVPLLLALLLFAVWSILSGVWGLLQSASSRTGRGIPDMMAFLKERYTKKSRTNFLSDDQRRPLIPR